MSDDLAATHLLSLPQRMYLLCYDLAADDLGGDTAQVRGQLLRAAAVAELRLAGHLHDHDGRAARDRSPDGVPDDPFLAEVLGTVPVDGGKRWFGVVDDRWWAAEASVRDQLVARGVITPKRRRWLGILPHLGVTATDPALVGDVRDRVRRVVLEGDPAGRPTADAVLAEIAVDGVVGTVFTHREVRAHRPAVDALAAHVNATLPGLRQAVVWSVAARRSATSV